MQKYVNSLLMLIPTDHKWSQPVGRKRDGRGGEEMERKARQGNIAVILRITCTGRILPGTRETWTYWGESNKGQ